MDSQQLPPGMDADYFARLPQSVREETLAKWHAEVGRVSAFKARLAKRAIRAALFGAIFMGLYGLLLPGGWSTVAILATGGLVAGASIIHFRLGVLSGPIVFGGMHVALTCICAGLQTGHQSFFGGWMTGMTYLFIFSTWIFSCVAGVLMARSAEAARIMEDSF